MSEDKTSGVELGTVDPTEGGRLCGANKTNGEGTCRKTAGHGTDHTGIGRCSKHGGSTQSVTTTHGRYSALKHEELRELVAKHARDDEPLDLKGELFLLRALIEDYINRYQENRDAILAWHQSYLQRPISGDRVDSLRRVCDELEALLRDDRGRGWSTEALEEQLALARSTVERLELAQDNKPRQILDITSAHVLIGEVTRAVSALEKARAQDAISRTDLLRVMTHFGRVVETYVKDEALLEKIKEGWLTIWI